METWKIALNKFMKQYTNKPWFEGAVLCGSYAAGKSKRNKVVSYT